MCEKKNSGQVIVELNDVSYRYQDSESIFEKINLSIHKNEIIGLLGKIGSGKSTLACLIKGLLKPSKGKIIFAGNKASEKDFCKVGVVFQYPENQLFEETVLKDVMFGPKNLGFNENDAKEKAIASLKDVGFDQEKIFESPFELSGGEKKLAAIAGILAMEPEILILDEPTAGLDIFAKYVFLKLIFDLHQKKNNTIIFISHSYEDIKLIADRILTIVDKKMIEMV